MLRYWLGAMSFWDQRVENRDDEACCGVFLRNPGTNPLHGDLAFPPMLLAAWRFFCQRRKCRLNHTFVWTGDSCKSESQVH